MICLTFVTVDLKSCYDISDYMISLASVSNRALPMLTLVELITTDVIIIDN